MSKVEAEMPVVSSCVVKRCAYNVENACHAKAITVGDYVNPNCHTFIEAKILHNRETKRIAGVGACKTINCKFNQDFECAAENIEVGFFNGQIGCLTYEAKT